MEKQAGVGIDFQDAKQVKQGASAVRRDAPKLTVSPTGACRTNTLGKELIGDFIKRLGGDPKNYQLTYKGAEEAGVMGLYQTKLGDAGVMNVTIYANSANFHAGACFEEFPKLRPAAKVDCHLEETVDAKGNPCVVVHVIAGSPSRIVKRKKKGTANKPGPETPDETGTDGEAQS
jgi:hypothetical protein